MDWRLTYRSEEDMEALLAVLEEKLTTNVSVFTDAWSAIQYATAERLGTGTGSSGSRDRHLTTPPRILSRQVAGFSL
jgi:hypothetical protein